MRLRVFGRVALGLLFVAAGLNHFRQPRFYLRMMPPYLPYHQELVDLSGYAEVALGALALVPGAEPAARWGLIALLAAVFPANLHMALNPERFRRFPRWALWLRLPLQAALIALVDWCLRPHRRG
ncbi:MAG TPA: hypothetical protein VFS21_01480 [Roseiflexaceae bacterium]|nr:hypothetical protein [Roseiflexaceae bacterium]